MILCILFLYLDTLTENAYLSGVIRKKTETTMTTIANPIYDSVFKFMLEDERVARILLSALLKKEVLQKQDRMIEQQDRMIEQQDRMIEQQVRMIEQQVKMIEQQDRMIEQQDRMIKQQQFIISSAVTALHRKGMTIEEISAMLSIPTDEAKKIVEG